MKKVLSLVLAAAMVATMGVTAFATDYNGVSVPNTNLKYDETTPTTLDTGYGSKPDKSIFIEVDQLTVGAGPAGFIASELSDDDLFKFSAKKGSDNSKMIKKISLVETKVSGVRDWFIKIELNDTTSADEFKISPEFTFTAKTPKNGKTHSATIAVGEKISFDATIWVQNSTVNADADLTVANGGVVIKPTKNDDNEITWNDANNILATLKFYSDDNAAKFYPKMTTKWDNAEYAAKFAHTDAFIRSFVGNPTIASTSRATLELNNPFVDEDGNVTVEEVVIYEVIDGELVNVSDKFTATTNDDDEEVFTIRTRTLGTYIIAAEEAAVAAEEVVDAPSTDKTNPGTGR